MPNNGWNQSGSNQTDQQESWDFIAQSPLLLRVLLGLVGSAVVAYYVSLVPLAMTGTWVVSLTSGGVLKVVIVGSCLNLASYKRQRHVLFGVVAAGLFGLLVTYLMLIRLPPTLDVYKFFIIIWQICVPSEMLLLNGLFFQRYRIIADLN